MAERQDGLGIYNYNQIEEEDEQEAPKQLT